MESFLNLGISTSFRPVYDHIDNGTCTANQTKNLRPISSRRDRSKPRRPQHTSRQGGYIELEERDRFEPLHFYTVKEDKYVARRVRYCRPIVSVDPLCMPSVVVCQCAVFITVQDCVPGGPWYKRHIPAGVSRNSSLCHKRRMSSKHTLCLRHHHSSIMLNHCCTRFTITENL